MTTRTACCRCGQLRATATGEPVRVSVCHCLNCQKRSGSAFAVQARWPSAQVAIEGPSKTFVITADSGNKATFHFCPDCGSDVYYTIAGNPQFADLIAIPVGAFADPHFPPPHYSVWEQRRHAWVEITGDDVEHFDQKILSYAGRDVLDALMRLTAEHWVEVQGVILPGHTFACQSTAFPLPGDVAISAITRELCDFR